MLLKHCIFVLVKKRKKKKTTEMCGVQKDPKGLHTSVLYSKRKKICQDYEKYSLSLFFL